MTMGEVLSLSHGARAKMQARIIELEERSETAMDDIMLLRRRVEALREELRIALQDVATQRQIADAARELLREVLAEKEPPAR